MSTPQITQRNKTRRASHTPAELIEDTQEQDLEKFLNLNANNAYKRPWHKMERGFHLNRLRRFVETETARMGLSSEDAILLQSRLERAYDKKLLKSKTYVIYDQESEEIQEIKGLVYHKTAEGRVLSSLVEKKGVTFRRKPAQNMKPVGDKVEEAPPPPA